MARLLLLSERILKLLHLGCPLNDAALLEVMKNVPEAALSTLAEGQVVDCRLEGLLLFHLCLGFG